LNNGQTRGFPGDGASNDSGIVENGNFQHFLSYFFRSFSGDANIIIYRQPG